MNTIFRISDIIHKRSFDFLLRFDSLFYFTPTSLRQKKLLTVLHNFTDKVIVDRREKLLKSQESVIETSTEDDVGVKKKMALLDVLLQSTIEGKPLTNLEIREEVDTFMFEVSRFVFKCKVLFN